jgi:hypothetical protein
MALGTRSSPRQSGAKFALGKWIHLPPATPDAYQRSLEPTFSTPRPARLLATPKRSVKHLQYASLGLRPACIARMDWPNQRKVPTVKRSLRLGHRGPQAPLNDVDARVVKDAAPRTLICMQVEQRNCERPLNAAASGKNAIAFWNRSDTCPPPHSIVASLTWRMATCDQTSLVPFSIGD